MKLQIKPMTLDVDFGMVYGVRDRAREEELYRQGYAAGRQQGYSEGEAAGYARGYGEGYAAGYAVGFEEGGRDPKLDAPLIRLEVTKEKLAAPLIRLESEAAATSAVLGQAVLGRMVLGNNAGASALSAPKIELVTVTEKLDAPVITLEAEAMTQLDAPKIELVTVVYQLAAPIIELMEV